MSQLRKTLKTFELRDNTFICGVKANSADRITLEIGDGKEPGQFVPQARVQRWDKELTCRFAGEVCRERLGSRHI